MAASVNGHPLVMPGLVPGIHVFFAAFKTWMAGTSPAMTANLSEPHCALG